jgi:O-antigen/teichoic acid export membrane protein
MGLKEKTLSGIIWSVGQQFGAKVIGLLITIVLARILAPAEFGLIAMLSVLVALGNNLSDSGLSSSLIRTAEISQKEYSTVFFFNLIGSIVIYLFLFFGAPAIASFYNQDILTKIIRVYGLALIINAFFCIQNACLVKNMDFKTQTNIQLPASIGGGILGIVLAKMGYGVWSLVWMNLLTSSLSTIMHWIYSDWRPIFIFDYPSFKKHFHFGYKMTLSGILNTVYQNIYTLIIGKYYSATQLGFYARAESLSQLPIGIISSTINTVTYPMFSEIAEDDIKLKEVNKRLIQQLVFWNAPFLILLCIIAEPLFRLLLTEKWVPAVPYFQILCLSGIIYPLHSYNLNILKVKGRSDLVLRVEFIKKSLSILGIFGVISFGIYGLLYFQLFFNFFGYYINTIYSGKLINYHIKEQIIDFLPTILFSVIVGAFSYLLDVFLINHFNLIIPFEILIISTFYFTVYLTGSYLVKMNAITDFKNLILKR